MSIRCILLAALSAALATASPPAASGELPSGLAPAPALVAWRPHPWTPAAPVPLRPNGLRVAIDPVDGTLGMPAPDEPAWALAAGDDRPVRVTYRANGSGRAQLDDRWADFAVVTLGADGKPVWSCVHGSRGAARWLNLTREASPPCADSPAPPPIAPWADK
jgi:hypothetical protein